MNMVVDIAIHVVYNKINKNLRILNNGLWVTKKDKIYWLRKITTINLKKIGGGSAGYLLSDKLNYINRIL